MKRLIQSGHNSAASAGRRVLWILAATALLVMAVGCAETTSDPATGEDPAVGSSAVSETGTPSGTSSTDEGNADVTFVAATQTEDGTWTFEVTVEHPDTGWEDYVDGWDVVTLDGEVLKVDPADTFTRLLAHPHVNEQPVTRSQSGIAIPEDVLVVVVRAHDIVDGFGGEEVSVQLDAVSGDRFEISR